MGEQNDTYVYRGTQPHYRSNGREVEVIEPGDEVELADSELVAFRDKFEPVDSASDEDEEAEGEEPADVLSPTDPNADDGTGSDPAYTEGQLNAMSYSELRDVAKDYESVPGNVSEYEMRLKLKQEMGHAPEEEEAEQEGEDADSDDESDEDEE